MLALLALIWIGVVAVFLMVWGRFQADLRAQDGVDEEAYVNGWSDETSRLRRLSKPVLQSGVRAHHPKPRHHRRLTVTFVPR
jgi:hypothetical protein